MNYISKAPGRICLFGDHQDYLGLPIIACAIDRYAQISGTPNDTDVFYIKMPDIGREFKLRFREKTQEPHTLHLIHSLTVVGRYGCVPNMGYNLTIQSDIPINAGISSSSAIVVAWMQWLLQTYGCHQKITPKLIGQLAYEAEVLEQRSAGGKMDQYTSAIGGTIFLETNDASKVLELDKHVSGLILGESGVPKDTEGLLGDLKGSQLSAIKKVKESHPNFDIHTATLTDFENFKTTLSTDESTYLYAAIKNHLITQEALECFRKSEIDLIKIGDLMNAHHTVLRDSLQITVPKIDAMITAAIDAGAYGAKIVGSGGGGSICAISPKGKEEQIITAIKQAGAIKAYQVSTSKGAHIL